MIIKYYQTITLLSINITIQNWHFGRVIYIYIYIYIKLLTYLIAKVIICLSNDLDLSEKLFSLQMYIQVSKL